MRVTIGDVAEQAKMNKGSVSRILNGKGGGYSITTQQRIMQIAVDMGYQPNALAQALGSGQTNTVALWLLSPEYYSPYYGYLQHCIQRQGARHGYQILTEFVPHMTSLVSQKSKLVNWPVDGIICSYMSAEAVGHLHSMIKKRCPIVCIQQMASPVLGQYPHIDYIDTDFYDGGKQAVEHLLQGGSRRIAFMAMPHMFEFPRAQAYRDLLGQAGIATEFIAVAEESRSHVAEALNQHIAQHGCPDGLFCNNDELAIGSYVALQRMDIRVPDDVLIVGYDGLDNGRDFSCPISTVNVPLKEMSNLAWDYLLERMKTPNLPSRRTTLPTQLEVRESSTRLLLA